MRSKEPGGTAPWKAETRKLNLVTPIETPRIMNRDRRMGNLRSRQGLHTTWYPDGTKFQEGSHKDGKRDGLWKQWHWNGQLWFRAQYRDNKVVGRETSWHDNGQLWYEADHVDGERTMRIVSLHDELGRDPRLPDGDIEVWKVGRNNPPTLCNGLNWKRVYISLRVPADARRVSPFDFDKSYGSRVEHAIVVGIEDAHGNPYTQAYSLIHTVCPLTYVVGQVVRPDGFDPDPTVECGQGIHVVRYKEQCRRWGL